MEKSARVRELKERSVKKLPKTVDIALYRVEEVVVIGWKCQGFVKTPQGRWADVVTEVLPTREAAEAALRVKLYDAGVEAVYPT